MSKLIIIGILFFTAGASSAQILNPVKFNYTATKKSNGTYELHIKAVLEPHWHIYSIHNPEGGAQATSIKLKNASPAGKIREVGKLISIHDNAFNVNQKFFENSVEFVQEAKLKNNKSLEGTLEYMICNDHQCLPPKEVEFKVKL